MSMPTVIFVLFVLPAVLVLASCGDGTSERNSASDPGSVFSRLEHAIRGEDRALFEAEWHPQGFRENLVGGSGLAGSRVFEQGARKKWYLKPDLGAARTVDGVTVVPADVWSWERDRAVDRLDVAIVTEGGRPVVLGAGESSAEVDALARRFAKGEPLAPPK